MAQAAHLPSGPPKTPPENVGRAPVLLAACKATVCQLRNQQWQGMFDSKAFRLQLLRNGPGNFVLLIVDEQKLVVLLNYWKRCWFFVIFCRVFWYY